MKRLSRKSFGLLFCLNVTLRSNNPYLRFSWIKLIAVFLCLTTNPTLLAASETDGRLDSVTLKLKWKHQFQFAGYYAALEKGFYRQEGLDVEIIEAKEGEESTEIVLSGDAEFGTAMSDLVLLRANGHPVVVLASIFQHSPLMILVPKSTGIQNIHDLSGRRIALEPHSEEILAYMKHEGIPLSEMVVHEHTYDTSPLINGEIDAMSAYSTDEPFVLMERGMAYHAFSTRSGGIDFYGDTLFTTEQQVLEHPERVSAFLKASIAGWEYAVSHSEEIIDLILSKYSRRHSREHLVYEAEMTRRLIMADVVGIGYMNPGRWKHIADTYAELGMADKDYSLEGFIYDPNPKTDFRRLYISLAVVVLIALVVFLIALHFYKLNRLLKKEIKERQQAEKEVSYEKDLLQTLLNNIPDYVFFKDKNRRFVRVSNFFSDIFRCSLEDIIGKKDEDLFPEEIAKETAGDDRHVIETGIPLVNKEEGGGSIGGGEHWVLTTKVPWRDKEGNIIGLFGISREITERKRAEEALLRAHDELERRVKERTAELTAAKEQLRVLSAQLLKAQEEERKGIARELHDGIGQSLSAIKFGVENALRGLDKGAAGVSTDPLEAVIPLAQEAIEEVRRIQGNLRPSTLDDLGILATVSWFCREFRTIYSGIQIKQLIDIQENDVPDLLKIIVYRVLQEALNNIAKHSKADLVNLSLRKVNDTIELTVEDNGLGFDLEDVLSVDSSKRGLGLASMRERTQLSGGAFSVKSIKGKGSIVRTSWPCQG